MLRWESCSKFRSITGRQKDYLCNGRKAVPNLDPSLADRRIIYATVEKLFQIQIHHWQTEGLFMLRQKSCSKVRSISSRQKDYLCYGRKAVPNLDPSLADRIWIHHWQTKRSFMLRQKSCSKFRSITGRQKDYFMLLFMLEMLFQIYLYQQLTKGSFMLRWESCSKFSCIRCRQKDHLCYDRKAVPN